MKRFLLPLAIFVVVVGFFGIGLTLNPREVPSPLVGKLAPDLPCPNYMNLKTYFPSRI